MNIHHEHFLEVVRQQREDEWCSVTPINKLEDGKTCALLWFCHHMNIDYGEFRDMCDFTWEQVRAMFTLNDTSSSAAEAHGRIETYVRGLS